MSTMAHPFQGGVREAVGAVLRVLAARRLAVPDQVAERVKSCTDLAVLAELQVRAATVERAEDLFLDQAD